MALLKSTNVIGNLSATGNIIASKVILNGGNNNSLLLAGGNTKLISDFATAEQIAAANVSINNLSSGKVSKAGDTMTGPLTNTHVSNTWINSCNGKSAYNVGRGSYTGWISGYAKDGRMAISTYPNSDNKLYFIYMKNDTITAGTNSTNAAMTWDGSTNTLTATTFTGALNGNATSATILKPTDNISTTTAEISTWGANVPTSNAGIVWRERFINPTLTGNNDSGDLVLWLQKQNDSSTILNMTIDGYLYQNLNKRVLDVDNVKGATTYIPKFTAVNTIGNSHITDNDSLILSTLPFQANGIIKSYQYSTSNKDWAAFVFDKPGGNWTGIGAHGITDLIHFGPCDPSGQWVNNYDQIWNFQGDIQVQGNYKFALQPGAWNAKFEYNSDDKCIDIIFN